MRAWSLDPGGTQCKGNGEAKEGTPSLGRHDPAKGDVRNPYCRGQVIEADKKHLEVIVSGDHTQGGIPGGLLVELCGQDSERQES